MKRRTNFDVYLNDQLRNPDFAGRFKKAGESWEGAIQLAELRKKSRLYKKEMTRKAGTSRQLKAIL